MTIIYKYNNKVLSVNGKIAISEECCCDNNPACECLIPCDSLTIFIQGSNVCVCVDETDPDSGLIGPKWGPTAACNWVDLRFDYFWYNESFDNQVGFESNEILLSIGCEDGQYSATAESTASNGTFGSSQIIQYTGVIEIDENCCPANISLTATNTINNDPFDSGYIPNALNPNITFTCN